MIEGEQTEQGQNSVEIVELNKEFTLFLLSRTKSRPSPRGFEQATRFSSSVLLRTGILPELLMNINTYAQRSKKLHGFTPFSPSGGYRVSQADFNLESRIKKIRRLRNYKQYGGQEIDFNRNPLYIKVKTDSSALAEAELGTEVLYSLLEDPKLVHLGERLRLQLFFPGGAFEAKGHILNGVEFQDFYPADLGPLAALSAEEIINRGLKPIIEIFDLHEGLDIFVPSNLNILQKIKGKFVLVAEGEEQIPLDSTPEPPIGPRYGGLIRPKNST